MRARAGRAVAVRPTRSRAARGRELGASLAKTTNVAGLLYV